MNAGRLSDLLDDRPVRECGPGIFSVLPADTPGQRYDSRARTYDRMIGNRLYNRLLWGCSPEYCRAFARRAVASAPSGSLLDAGCGTLLFTADAYSAAPGGQLFVTSLVANGRFGDRYLRLLHRAGELAPPRDTAALERAFRQVLPGGFSYSVVGNMVFATSPAESHVP